MEERLGYGEEYRDDHQEYHAEETHEENHEENHEEENHEVYDEDDHAESLEGAVEHQADYAAEKGAESDLAATRFGYLSHARRGMRERDLGSSGHERRKGAGVRAAGRPLASLAHPWAIGQEKVVTRIRR